MEKCPKELERMYWKDKDFVIAALSQSIDALNLRLSRLKWTVSGGYRAGKTDFAQRVKGDLSTCCPKAQILNHTEPIQKVADNSMRASGSFGTEEKSSRVLLGGQGGDACRSQD